MKIQNKLLLLLLFCVSSKILFAQKLEPYAPIQFKDYNPIWQHYSKVSTFSDSIQSYVLEREPIFDSNAIYLLENIFDSYFQGYLFEKIDMATGKTLWQNHEFASKLNTRKYANTLSVFNDKIELTVYKENQVNPPAFYPTWVQANLNSVTYDKQTGNKLDSLKTIASDSMNFRMIIPFVFTNPNRISTQLIPYANNKYWYMRHNIGLGRNRHQKFILNNQGHLIDSSSYELPNKYVSRAHTHKRLENGRFLLFCFSASDTMPVQEHEARITFFDKDFKLDKTIDYTSQLPQGDFCSLAYADNDYVIIRTHTGIEIDGITTIHQIHFSLFTHTGVHLKTVKIEANEDFRGGQVALLPNTQTIVMVNSLLENGKTFVQILKSLEDNTLKELKKIEIINDKNQLFLKKIAIANQNNDIFCYFNQVHEKNIKEGVAPSIKWSVAMLFSGKDLGLVVADNEVVESEDISLFPNPTYNHFSIQTSSTYDAVLLTDVLGRKVLYTEAKETIDITTLPKGLYFVQLFYKGEVVNRARSMVKIE
jgi:hypothetical protein